MKPLKKSVFHSDKNQPKFCRKTCWKEQPSIFTVFLMNHIFQASVLILKCIELNWLCKQIKKIRSSQPAILVLNWVKHHSFHVSIVNENIRNFVKWETKRLAWVEGIPVTFLNISLVHFIFSIADMMNRRLFNSCYFDSEYPCIQLEA